MDTIGELFDMFLHLDRHLAEWTAAYHGWVYVILFGIVFAETGLVVTPFLPGDSLLFAAGYLASQGSLSVWMLILVLFVAGVLGDSVNYWIGSRVGPGLVRGERVRLIRQKHLDRTHEFFERYGGKTIVLARFVPIVRTFAPFVAGMGSMTYSRFVVYNVAGAALWVLACVWAGYVFGGLEVVRKNFSLVVLAIVVVSVMPAVVEVALARRRSRKKVREAARPACEQPQEVKEEVVM